MEENEQQCCICSSSESLLQVQEKWICEQCLQIGIEKLTLPWKESLEVLLKEYSNACQQCLSADQPEFVHQARVIGSKIRGILEFIGVPNKHKLLLAVRKVNKALNKIRETDVLLYEMELKKEENKVYAEMVKVLTKVQKKLQKQIATRIPEIINDSFYNNVETFINSELISYIVRIDKEKMLLQTEESFNQLINDYHQAVKDEGKMAAAAIDALHAVRKKAKALRYVYSYLNETFDGRYQDKESYFKKLQRQFGDINDTEDWLIQIKAYQKKLDAPKRDISEVKNILKAKLQNLIENVDFFEASVKES